MTRDLMRLVRAGAWNDSVLFLADGREMYAQRVTLDDTDKGKVWVLGYFRPTATAWCSWHNIAAADVTRTVH